MTVLSAYLGFAVTVIPRTYTVYLSTFLFVFFGLKMLREGYAMGADEGAEELEEVTQELKKKEEALAANESSRRLVQGSRIFMQVCWSAPPESSEGVLFVNAKREPPRHPVLVGSGT